MMNRIIFIAALLIGCLVDGEAQVRNRYEIWFGTLTSLRQLPAWSGGEAPEWESKSLPLGNGSIGAHVFGTPDSFVISMPGT